MQDRGGDRKVYHQGDRVHDRGDERRRHHRGVEAQLLREHRQGTADELRDKDRDDHRQAYHKRDDQRDVFVMKHQPIKEHQLAAK